MTNETLFDVVIYEKATRKIDAIIGKKMRRWNGVGSWRNTAELRHHTGRDKLNDLYDAEIVEAGKYKEGDILP